MASRLRVALELEEFRLSAPLRNPRGGVRVPQPTAATRLPRGRPCNRCAAPASDDAARAAA
eukprot:895986-Lingulodinium_polyedra.AAC.1